MTFLGGRGRVPCVRCRLGSLLIFSIHRHALARKDVRKSTFVSELAVSFHEPRTYFLLLARFENVVREWARRAGGTGTDLEEFAGYMRQILG